MLCVYIIQYTLYIKYFYTYRNHYIDVILSPSIYITYFVYTLTYNYITVYIIDRKCI